MNLLNIAEQALLKLGKQGKGEILEDGDSVIVRRRFVLSHRFPFMFKLNKVVIIYFMFSSDEYYHFFFFNCSDEYY